MDPLSTFAHTYGLDDEALAALRTLQATLSSAPQSLGRRLDVRYLAGHGDDDTADSGDRYTDEGLLGRGGMGEVRRVRDTDLNRSVALKWIPADSHPAAVDRFLHEAQVTAQLQHPGIPPVFEVGTLPDGRPYYTMKEVRGRTLHEVIRAVHRASTAERWRPEPDGATFRRLVDALLRTSEAVAYAHERGIVHRDLKSENVMIGAFGEVLVLDWGIAKVIGDDPRDVRTDRSEGSAWTTRAGAVTGTPAYMAPEQAEGGAVDARSDVYALGAMLYEILQGKPPFHGLDAMGMLVRKLHGPPDDPSPSDAPAPPADLVAACRKAMARAPEDRFDEAGSFATALGAWLDGARRRERALQVVDRADGLTARIDERTAEAATLRQTARDGLQEVPRRAPLADKLPYWRAEDRAAALDREAAGLRAERVELLQAAFTHEPDLPEAHARLADHFREAHVDAERRRATDAPALASRLAAHDRGQHAAYLRGLGAVTLVTDPPGAAVRAFRMAVGDDRRRVPVFDRELGRTPLVEVPLPHGAWLLELVLPGRPVVRYPIAIDRLGHWHGVPPGAAEAHPVVLPAQLEPSAIYVPAGWATLGGDDRALNPWPATPVWVDAFVIDRHTVTNGEYIRFLNALVADGRGAEAERAAPQERAKDGLVQIFDRLPDGRFTVGVDADGHEWDPGFPVMMIDWDGARAYAAWRAADTGEPWRLPLELEWEKAARGADGRLFPWGDHLDPALCNMRHSLGRPLPVVRERFPHDASPYGVRHLAGNAAEWCGDRFRPAAPNLDASRLLPSEPCAAGRHYHRAWRGSSYWLTDAWCRSASRDYYPDTWRSPDLGFRVLRPLSGPSPVR